MAPQCARDKHLNLTSVFGQKWLEPKRLRNHVYMWIAQGWATSTHHNETSASSSERQQSQATHPHPPARTSVEVSSKNDSKDAALAGFHRIWAPSPSLAALGPSSPQSSSTRSRSKGDVGRGGATMYGAWRRPSHGALHPACLPAAPLVQLRSDAICCIPDAHARFAIESHPGHLEAPTGRQQRSLKPLRLR